MSDDVGTIRVAGDEVTLGADLRWRGQPDLARILNLTQGAVPWSPALGDKGGYELARAARQTGGTITAFLPPPEGEPGRVY